MPEKCRLATWASNLFTLTNFKSAALLLFLRNDAHIPITLPGTGIWIPTPRNPYEMSWAPHCSNLGSPPTNPRNVKLFFVTRYRHL